MDEQNYLVYTVLNNYDAGKQVFCRDEVKMLVEYLRRQEAELFVLRFGWTKQGMESLEEAGEE